ncbi:hypothetical protein GINT2_001656 [Glugoides intestinalis]
MTEEVINFEEQQYLNIIKECIENGSKQSDRTGTGTLSCFGRSMRFSLVDGKFPLLTTKLIPFRIVLEELLFFVRGQTDNTILKEKKVHIWDGNSSKEYYEKNGIDREEDDLGPVYGFQWRHFGAIYKNCKSTYTGQGIDQLENVIKTLKENPTSRRMIVTAWNPLQLKEMALPPCHCLFQFLAVDGKLTCILYQRSGDVGLGIPFNIASYSLLTIMVAKIAGLIPHEFVHFIGDTHVYLDHVIPLKMQLLRTPRAFPTIRIAEKEYKSIEDFCFEDFILEGYNPYPKVKMDMSV